MVRENCEIIAEPTQGYFRSPDIGYRNFPSTRYQGSKLKLLDWIWESVRNLKFQSVLDAFGGTGCVSYLFKCQGKQVTYNDALKFNYQIGLALIENQKVFLEPEDIDWLINQHSFIRYRNVIADNFKGIYFIDEENRWLDVLVQNIGQMKNKYKQALAWFAVFQSCIAKRPYNLFHRKNLYIRTAEVERSFGNKTTWDTPFEVHFKKYIAEANACVFANEFHCRAANLDAFAINRKYDLVYIDTPYISKNGVGVDYFEFYHFLEGLVRYNEWENLINYQSKHRRLKGPKSLWTRKGEIHGLFETLVRQFPDSILAISYRSDGIPTREELGQLLGKYRKTVVENHREYKYVLSNNKGAEEVLFVAY